MDSVSAITGISGQLPINTANGFMQPASMASEGNVSFGKLAAVDGQPQSSTSAEQDAVKYKAVHDFTTIITQQFVDEMFKGQLTFGEGQGMQTDFQRTVFIKAISEQLAEADALGISKFIQQGVSEK